MAQGLEAQRAQQFAAMAGGSVEVAQALADPKSSDERADAIAQLRRAASGPLATLLQATSDYGNTGEDRVRLRETLTALLATEAIELRRLVATGGAAQEIDAAVHRHDAAVSVIASLERNANVPLALEAAWLGVARRI
ncbi:MAG: hypothetical protein NVSMB47_16670 [Polyangiales bacterium]